MDDRFWDERYAAAELIWTAEPCRSLVAEMNGLAPGPALDLACGEGRNAVWLATRVWDVTGFDFSRGRPRQSPPPGPTAPGHGRVDPGRRRHLPAAPPGFDLVAILYLQLPAEPLAAALDNAGRALAMGAPSWSAMTPPTSPAATAAPQDPAIRYSPDDIVTSLDSLVLDKAERVRRPVQTDQGAVEAIYALVRAHDPRSPSPGMTGRGGRQSSRRSFHWDLTVRNELRSRRPLPGAPRPCRGPGPDR